MEKNYISPEFDFIQVLFTKPICVSNPEGFGGEGGWGEESED